MSLSGALARTRMLMEKADVPTAMTKVWKNVLPAEGEITQHLSPNEQRIIIPWIKTFPNKVVQRVPTYLWPIGTAFFTYAVCAYTSAKDAEEDYQHRY